MRTTPETRRSGDMHAGKSDRCVTVVIPVYRDIHATLACLASCREHIDARHTVIVINDASPDEGMADAVRAAVSEMPNARYEEHTKNRGFVQTCNRAVNEADRSDNDILLLNSDTIVTAGFLEEMLECMYASERHGVCCPRSNTATLCTIPLRYDGNLPLPPKVSFACWLRMRNLLPRYSVIPTGVGFCMLIRRKLIRRFGLFGPAYGRGYDEENDFYCRINRYGYSAIMANHAYVTHRGGTSFGEEERGILKKKNARTLHARFPRYERSVEQYLQSELSALEHFADIMGACYPRRRILFDVSRLPGLYNGSTEYAFALLRELEPMLSDMSDVWILCNEENDATFGLRKRYDRVLMHMPVPDRRFDLAFVPHQIFDPSHWSALNEMSLRIVCTMQDVIAVRCRALHAPNMVRTVRTAFRECDGLLFISETARNDAKACDQSIHFTPTVPTRVVRHGVEPAEMTGVRADKPFWLLVGNAYPHKAVSEALRCVPEKECVVVLGGTSAQDMRGRDTIFLESGTCTPELVQSLYAQCTGVIFPSQYEGFGLPVLHAASAGKPIIVADTEVNREIRDTMDLRNHMHLFSNFNELPDFLRHAASAPPPPRYVARTWKESAAETASFLKEILEQPVDPLHLERRFQAMRRGDFPPPPSEAPPADVQASARALARAIIIKAGLGPAARGVQRRFKKLHI